MRNWTREDWPGPTWWDRLLHRLFGREPRIPSIYDHERPPPPPWLSPPRPPECRETAESYAEIRRKLKQAVADWEASIPWLNGPKSPASD